MAQTVSRGCNLFPISTAQVGLRESVNAAFPERRIVVLVFACQERTERIPVKDIPTKNAGKFR